MHIGIALLSDFQRYRLELFPRHKNQMRVWNDGVEAWAARRRLLRKEFNEASRCRSRVINDTLRPLLANLMQVRTSLYASRSDADIHTQIDGFSRASPRWQRLQERLSEIDEMRRLELHRYIEACTL